MAKYTTENGYTHCNGGTHHHACDCREAKVARLVEAAEAAQALCMDGFVCFSLLTKERLDEVDEKLRAALDEWRK